MTKRITSAHIRKRKHQTPLVCLTAYTSPMARLLDPYCDLLLVGDSLGMVIYGFDSTLPVTMRMMIDHGRAVTNASNTACVVVDMPFGSYQASKEIAFENAAKLIKKTGCHAVKIEGGQEMTETINYLTKRGIPVLGHVGLKPQSVNVYGHYGVRGKSEEEHNAILNDAKAIEQAGAFSIILENIPATLADSITSSVSVPTIGIGASSACDGQVLVTEDITGLTGSRVPKFVKQYATLHTDIDRIVQSFATDVKSRQFPEQEHIS